MSAQTSAVDFVSQTGCRLTSQWFRTRTLMHAHGPSAVHSNGLFELDALHASDQYDLMRGVCRGLRGEERAWERVREGMGRVDRK